MNSIWNELRDAFVDDHRKMTQGYERLLTAIDAGDFASASNMAVRLDELAGPHIEFEERFLYPTVKSIRGEAYVSNLYDEHAKIVRAISEIASLQPGASPTAQQAARWTTQLKHGLDHAASCGSLLSHLQVQSVEKQREYLQAIQRLRKGGTRWSELSDATKTQK